MESKTANDVPTLGALALGALGFSQKIENVIDVQSHDILQKKAARIIDPGGSTFGMP